MQPNLLEWMGTKSPLTKTTGALQIFIANTSEDPSSSSDYTHTVYFLCLPSRLHGSTHINNGQFPSSMQNMQTKKGARSFCGSLLPLNFTASASSCGSFLRKEIYLIQWKRMSKNYCILDTVLGALLSVLNSCPCEAFIIGGSRWQTKSVSQVLGGEQCMCGGNLSIK